MKICPKCNIEFDKNTKFCSRKCANSRLFSEETKRKKSEACKKFYSTDKGKELKLQRSEFAKAQKPAKETKKKISDSLIRYYQTENGLNHKKTISDRMVKRIISINERQKLSISAKKRKFGGHTSKHRIFFQKNNGEIIYLQSSFEIQFAEILEKLNIIWERPKPFIWVDKNNISHRYYPDFKINNIYVDTKNDYLALIDKPKIEAVKKQNNIDLRIVTEKQINKDYIVSLIFNRKGENYEFV